MEPMQILLAVIAICMVLLGWRLTHPPRRLVVRDRGILDRGLGLGWIAWDEIEGAWQPSRQDQQALHLRLRPGKRLARRLSDEGAGSPVDLRLDLTGTGLSPVELLREILARTNRASTRMRSRRTADAAR